MEAKDTQLQRELEALKVRNTSYDMTYVVSANVRRTREDSGKVGG